MPHDLRYVVLIFGLFVLPKFLQRFGIPGAVTSLLLGLASARLELVPHDRTVALLATFGIVGLFLRAGLEIDFAELRPARRALAVHLLVFAVLLGCASLVGWLAAGLEPRAAVLLALALLTPSAGFILDSLASFGLGRGEIRRVRAMVVATELLALGVLFAVTQSSSPLRFLGSALALLVMVLAIPPAVRAFARHIEPFAPRTEFAFLLMLAVVCAYATRKLGVYYLVGAFLVGVTARRFRDKLPAMSSDRLLNTVEEFAMVFGPFYFFHAGEGLRAADFGAVPVLLGFGLALVLLPVRAWLAAVFQGRRNEWTFRVRLRVGTALLPTLVFSIVLLGILRERFGLEGPLASVVMVYTLCATVAPAILLRWLPPPDVAAPVLPVHVERRNAA